MTNPFGAKLTALVKYPQAISYSHYTGETVAGADRTGIHAAVLDGNNAGVGVEAGLFLADREAKWRHSRQRRGD